VSGYYTSKASNWMAGIGAFLMALSCGIDSAPLAITGSTLFLSSILIVVADALERR
jgi:hypothetical protein